MIRLRRCHFPLTDYERDWLAQLHATCMPEDKLYHLDSAAWWLAMNGDEPVGFAGARYYPRYRAAFFVAAGVLPSHRRQGLHRRLIRARVRWAKQMGAARAVTYTMLYNAPSANGLIRERFRKSAAWCYAGSDVDYWERAIA